MTAYLNIILFALLCAFLRPNLAEDSSDHRGHKCHPEDIRLDLVFVLDSSAGVDKYGFAGEKAAIYGLLNELTISQQAQTSRAGFVNMANTKSSITADLKRFYTFEDAKKSMIDMSLLNEELVVKKGMAKAREVFETSDLRPGIPNVIILFSSTPINCDTKEPSSQYDACLLANKTKEDETLLISIALRYHEDENPREMKFGDYDLENNATLLDDLENILCTVSPFDPPELVPNACPCILPGLWLDIVVMFDSSDGAGKLGFAAQRAAIIGFLHQIFVNQKTGKFSRLAFINAGGTITTSGLLTQYSYSIEAIGDLMKMQPMGGDINLQLGFVKAAQIFVGSDKRSNAKNVLVVFTTHHLACENGASGCAQAKQLRDDGVIILTIDIALYGEIAFGSTFGSDCFKMTNSLYFLEKFEDYMCKANCFCIPPTIQFKDEGSCGIYGQCVYLEESPAALKSAEVGCGLNGMTLVDVYSEEKDKFLTKIATGEKCDKYSLGLTDINGDLVWSTGQTMGHDDFNLFGPGEPDARHGNCTYADLSDGKQSVWKTMECSYFKPALKYFCQKNTCDTGHYCESAR